MIRPGTRLKVLDNSGVLCTRCIGVIGKKVGYAGDMIVMVATQVARNSVIKAGEVFRGVILTTKKEEPIKKVVKAMEYLTPSRGAPLGDLTKPTTNSSLYVPSQENNSAKVADDISKVGNFKERFTENGVVLVKIVSGEIVPIGTRIKGPVSEKLKGIETVGKVIAIVK